MLLELTVLLVFCALFLPIVYSSIIAAPPVPTKAEDVGRMVQLAQIKPEDVVYDLGAGDGRLLLRTARETTSGRIIGCELSPVHALWCALQAFFRGYGGRVHIRWQNFYKTDLREADVIFCFLNPHALKRLLPKFEKELKPGTRLISYNFAIEPWQETVLDRPALDRLPIYVYQR